jgi:hypothetical protein
MQVVPIEKVWVLGTERQVWVLPGEKMVYVFHSFCNSVEIYLTSVPSDIWAWVPRALGICRVIGMWLVVHNKLFLDNTWVHANEIILQDPLRASWEGLVTLWWNHMLGTGICSGDNVGELSPDLLESITSAWCHNWVVGNPVGDTELLMVSKHRMLYLKQCQKWHKSQS